MADLYPGRTILPPQRDAESRMIKPLADLFMIADPDSWTRRLDAVIADSDTDPVAHDYLVALRDSLQAAGAIWKNDPGLRYRYMQ